MIFNTIKNLILVSFTLTLIISGFLECVTYSQNCDDIPFSLFEELEEESESKEESIEQFVGIYEQHSRFFVPPFPIGTVSYGNSFLQEQLQDSLNISRAPPIL